MYELIQLTERTYYIKSPTNIGLFRLDEKNVCLIDSGNDKDAGRRIRQVLDANGWQLTAIYNTHANADHIGGNRYLQGQTGCRIYAPGIDCAFTRHPVLEPSFLYGGYPPKDLRHKFLLAQESDAAELTADKLPEGFASIPLPGHFFDMVGFRTPDDVVFLADCRRWEQCYRAAGLSPRAPGPGDLLLAAADACIAAQNAVTAAESLGIGSCYIGDVIEQCEKMREALALPPAVVPAAMVVFGRPTGQQKARRKPARLPMEYVVCENTYADHTPEEHRAALAARAAADGKPAFDFDAWVRAFAARKYESDFSREMSRSASVYLRDFEGWDR